MLVHVLYIQVLDMLGLFNSIMRSMGLSVLPGGLLEDGDWGLMISVNWEDVDTSTGSDWENWNAAADS